MMRMCCGPRALAVGLLLWASLARADGLGLRFDAADVFVPQGQTVQVSARVANLGANTLELVGGSTDAGPSFIGNTCFDAFLAAAPATLGPYEAWQGGVITLAAPANADTGTTVIGVRVVGHDPLTDASTLGTNWIRVHVTPPGCLPLVALQPSGAALQAGGAATLTVQASSASPLQYQWRKDGAVLANNGAFDGVNTGALHVDPMSAAASGIYDCVLTNDCGSVTSSGAKLVLCTQPPFTTRADFVTPAGNALLVRRETEPIGHLFVSDGAESILDLAGNAAGSFQPAVPLATRPGTTQLLSADLNRDGIPDLVSFSPSDASYSVFLGAAGSGFQPRIDVAIAGTPVRIALGDLDGDGFPDLAISFANYTVREDRGLGSGQFEPASGIDADVATDMRIVDINHDGLGDLVVASDAQHRLSIYPNQGGLELSQSPLHFATLAGPLAFAIGDVTGDGVPDLVLTQDGGQMVSLYRGLAGSGFSPREDIASVPSPRAPQLADIDGDGDLDLVVADHGSANVLLFTNAGASGFDEPVSLAVGEGPTQAFVTDADGDGLPDVLALHDSPTGTTLLYQRCDSPATTGLGPGATPRTLSLAPGPNPFREGTRLTLTLPHASQVELGVYDASGRLVRRIQEGRLEPGTWGFAWDGRDAHEGVVRAGVYFVRARVDGSVIRTKLVRVP
jgi:hypothetical protein